MTLRSNDNDKKVFWERQHPSAPRSCSERIAHSWANRLATVTSFTLTHNLADLFAMHYGPRASPLCVQYCTQRLFHSKSIDLPTHKIWLLNFDLESPRSRSWLMSKFEVITWVQHPIDSHPFGSISIHPLIPMIELFQNLTFKIQGRSQSSMSHIMYNNLSTHIPVIPPVDRPPFLRCNYLKKWPWKFKVKIMGEVKSITP